MRVVIVEDDALLREGLSLLLAGEGFTVAAAVGDAEAFLAAVEAERPDLAVVDVRLPPGFRADGIKAALAARRLRPGLPVLLATGYAAEIRPGAEPLVRLDKPFTQEALADAINDCLARAAAI
ncbi:MAG TPA: response regulator [Phytomonospora sp.]